MAITLYSGTPGSGKSLHAAEIIYKRLRHNLPVIGNFEIRLDLIKPRGQGRLGQYTYCPNDGLSPDYLISYARYLFTPVSDGGLGYDFREGAILLILDECQLLFESDIIRRGGRKSEWLSFMSQHRKYGYDIILISQSDRNIDRSIRTLIEIETVHRDVRRFGFMGWLFSLLRGGRLFIAVSYWHVLRKSKASIVDRYMFGFNRRYAAIYDTFMGFGGFGKNEIDVKKPSMRQLS